jgi:hypothetical protein
MTETWQVSETPLMVESKLVWLLWWWRHGTSLNVLRDGDKAGLLGSHDYGDAECFWNFLDYGEAACLRNVPNDGNIAGLWNILDNGDNAGF